MSDSSQGPGWWQASDGKWYPPEQHPDAAAAAQPPTQPTPPTPQAPPPTPPGSTMPPQQPTFPGPAPGQAPYGAPGAYQGPPGAPPPGTAPGAPGGGGGGGKGTKIALVVIIVAILAGIGVAAVLLLGGGDDDDVATEASTTTEADESTTTTEDESTTTSGPRRTLVPRTSTTEGDSPTTTGGADGELGSELEAALGYDLDEATIDCALTEVLANPDLLDAASTGDLDPTSPEFAVLLEVLVGCGARDSLQQAFLDGMGESVDDPTIIACVQGVLDGLADDEFVTTIIGFANEDPTALALVEPCA